MNIMQGSGGGGGAGGSNYTRTPDSLKSLDTVEVLLGISEGPIYGLENGAKSFYLGDTVLQNPDDSFNFKAFTLNMYLGNADNEPVKPILTGVSSNSAVGVTLATNTPVVRETSTRNIDYIDLRLIFPNLQRTTDNGTFDHEIKFKIEYKLISSSTWIKLYNEDITLRGKSSSNYVKIFRIPVTRSSTTDYQIRITKLSAANTTTDFSDLVWESYQSIVTGVQNYPNTALVQLVGQSSDQFSSIPTWKGIYKGMLIRVPNNYNPETKIYTGTWNGTWKIAWTDNPAWILYDFVMNDRYGLKSRYLDINMDKYSVYRAALWCDEQVPNGQGGTQARFTFNAYIDKLQDGKELAKYIAASFNAILLDNLNGDVVVKLDNTDEAQHLFIKENISSDGFEYSYTDITTRFNEITVKFLNPELDWVEDRRIVTDENSIAKYGRISDSFDAEGCVNAHEAIRKAQYRLITANTETCIVNFKTNRLGSLVQPFDVILICDPDMGYGLSGRIKTLDVDRKTINLRDPLYLEIGVPYNLTIKLSDGNNLRIPLININFGYNTSLNLLTALPSNVPDKASFSLEATGLIGLPRPFRVTKVTEETSIDDYTIEAVSINRNKWYDSDNVANTGQVVYSKLGNPLSPPGPTQVKFTERFVKNLNRFELLISPVFDRSAYKYYTANEDFELWSRPFGTNFAFVKREVINGDVLVNHPSGKYDFKVLGKSTIGGLTPLENAPIYSFTLTNPKDAPKDVDWININEKEVTWGYEFAPADFAGFVLRYHNTANKFTWEDALPLHEGIITSTSFYSNQLPENSKAVLVKAVDSFGVASVNAVYTDRIFFGEVAYNTTLEINYNPDFNGSKTGGIVENGILKTEPMSDLFYSSNGGNLVYSSNVNSLFYKITYKDLVYEDDFSISIAGVMRPIVDIEGESYSLTYKKSTESVYRNIPISQSLTPGNYNIKLQINSGASQTLVRKLGINIGVPDKTENFNTLTVSSSGLRLPITKNYNTIKFVTATILDTFNSTAVSYKVIDKQTTINSGPLLVLLDINNEQVSGRIDARVIGY